MSYANNSIGRNFSPGTTANFRDWVSYISAAFLASGWIKTADTGQMDIATITPSGDNLVGYEVWRMADTLQGTKPVYLKIFYGSYGGSASVTIQIGTGSNGAGVITGFLKSFDSMFSYTNITDSTAKFAASGNTNRLSVAMNYTTGNTIFFSIERTKDAAGADNGVGVIFQASNAANNLYHQLLPFVGSIPPNEGFGNCLIPGSGGTVFGTNVGIFPMNIFYFGETVNPPTNFFGYRDADILVGSIITALVNGTPMSFLALGTPPAYGWFINGRNGSALMMRFE